MKKIPNIIPDYIPEEEVPNIIQRASELQSKVIYGNTKHTHREIHNIAEELEIEEQYIKQALEELYNNNEHIETKKKNTNKEMKFSNKHLLIIIIILLICLLTVFLSKDNTSDIVLSGNNSTLIMPRDNSIVELPKSSIDEDQTNTQKQFLLQQQIELLENKNRLLEEQKRASEKKELPNISEEQLDRTLDQERVKLQKQVQEFEQKTIEQQRALLEEQKKIFEERSKLLDERIQNSDSQQTNITIHTEDTEIITTETKKIEKTNEVQIPSPNFEGNWELVAYHLYDKEKESFLEVAVVKDKIEIRESWFFHSGRFRHIMDKNLSFSGKYEVLDSSALPTLKNTDIISGADFIIHAYDISTNFGSQIKHHYYYAEFDNAHLILYDVGRELQYRQPNQGHEFTKLK